MILFNVLPPSRENSASPHFPSLLFLPKWSLKLCISFPLPSKISMTSFCYLKFMNWEEPFLYSTFFLWKDIAFQVKSSRIPQPGAPFPVSKFLLLLVVLCLCITRVLEPCALDGAVMLFPALPPAAVVTFIHAHATFKRCGSVLRVP